MAIYVSSFLMAALIFFLLDGVWLIFASRYFFRPAVGDILREHFDLMAAGAFYVLYVTGIFIFAVVPAVDSGRWTTACTWGALFGLFAYATYDLTNLATLKSWPLWLAALDICWGTALTSLSATLGYVVGGLIAGWSR